MSKYNHEYFFIQENEEIENLPDLKPDKNTFGRKFGYTQQALGSAPLFFNNADKEDHAEDGIPVMEVLPNVLFRGNDILVTTDIRRELLKYNVPNMFTHPAVYIHDDDEWYEDYSFCTFTKSFDCWDRNESKYRDKPNKDKLDSEMIYAVAKFSLDDDFLDKTPLEERLLFKIGASRLAMITCHESIKHLFETEGSQTIPIAEW